MGQGHWEKRCAGLAAPLRDQTGGAVLVGRVLRAATATVGRSCEGVTKARGWSNLEHFPLNALIAAFANDSNRCAGCQQFRAIIDGNDNCELLVGLFIVKDILVPLARLGGLLDEIAETDDRGPENNGVACASHLGGDPAQGGAGDRPVPIL